LYNIYFFEDSRGNKPIKEFIRELGTHSDKESRVRLHKIQDYIKALREYGKSAGEPYVKHLDGEIWEIRPNRDRILLAAWLENGFVLLHHFVKKTQKTPHREMDQAKRNLARFKEVNKL
jgi:phage-related protein